MPNKERLRAVRARMVAHQDKFQYEHLFVFDTPDGIECVGCVPENMIEHVNECGTMCCVAGFTIQEAVEHEVLNGEYALYLADAGNYLQLHLLERDFLFCPIASERRQIEKRCTHIKYEARMQHLLNYPRLGEIDYRDNPPFEEALARIDWLLDSPE